MKMKKKSAMTLIELVIVIVVTGVIMLGLSSYIKQAIDTWNFLSYRSDVVNEARLGLVRMGRDIRALYQVNNATAANDFIFLRSANGPCVSYSYSGNALYYQETGANCVFTAAVPYPLMSGVTTSGNFFDYFNANMSPETNSAMIRYIKMNPKLNKKGQTVSLEYGVAPRNLQD